MPSELIKMHIPAFFSASVRGHADSPASGTGHTFLHVTVAGAFKIQALSAARRSVCRLPVA